MVLDTAPRDQASGLRSVPAASRTWTLAVTSGKGGVGKTSVAVSLALALAQAETRTCLVDGDLGLANVDVLLNLHPRHTLQEVLDRTGLTATLAARPRSDPHGPG